MQVSPSAFLNAVYPKKIWIKLIWTLVPGDHMGFRCKFIQQLYCKIRAAERHEKQTFALSLEDSVWRSNPDDVEVVCRRELDRAKSEEVMCGTGGALPLLLLLQQRVHRQHLLPLHFKKM